MNMPPWVQRLMPTKGRIRRSALYRLLGQSLFANDLWQFNERAVAGGLALGLFVAFTPTIPFQMILTAVGALYFRVNLPVGLAACWVTNPLTAVPFYWLAWKIGQYTMSEVPWIAAVLKSHAVETKLSPFLLQCLYLWAGCLLMATLAATIAHFTVRLTSYLIGRCATHIRPSETGAQDQARGDHRQEPRHAQGPRKPIEMAHYND